MHLKVPQDQLSLCAPLNNHCCTNLDAARKQKKKTKLRNMERAVVKNILKQHRAKCDLMFVLVECLHHSLGAVQHSQYFTHPVRNHISIMSLTNNRCVLSLLALVQAFFFCLPHFIRHFPL